MYIINKDTNRIEKIETATFTPNSALAKVAGKYTNP